MRHFATIARVPGDPILGLLDAYRADGNPAKLLMPGKDPGGWLVTMLLGIAGNWIDNFLFAALGLGNVGIIGACLGAMLLLFLHRILRRT